jgi:dolichol kinase
VSVGSSSKDQVVGAQPIPALSLRKELARKGFHLLSTVVPVAYAGGAKRAVVIWALAFSLAIALAIEIGRSRSIRTRGVFHNTVGGLLREHEWHGPSGATWLVLALLVAALLFPRNVAIAAMCAVALGDAAAAIVGRALARHSTHRKSFGGSAACFAASAISARAIAGFPWAEATIIGILAALAERPRGPLDDNLRIVIAVGCGILLWRMGFS